MSRFTFMCIDAHTCGNPVRVVTGGTPFLSATTMSERRTEFMAKYDWIRTALMYEPRGHDMMSGSMLYPPSDPQNDVGILYIETSGCLPMCGHGTIGTVTVMIEHNLVRPKQPGVLRLETPAGLVIAHYQEEGGRVTSVRITNVPSFLFAKGLAIDCPELGELQVDVAYGGNFYAIVEPQQGYTGLAETPVGDLIRISPKLRHALNQRYQFQHPTDPRIHGLSHIQWTGRAQHPEADARNAVFYGEKAIDRSPCGTGTSARLAQLVARGEVTEGDTFVHESIIGSLFRARVEGTAVVGEFNAIIPSIEGWARVTGINTIFVDEDDPFAHGFQVL